MNDSGMQTEDEYLSTSSEYAEYCMSRCDNRISNGDMLIGVMEAGLNNGLFDDFLAERQQ